MKILRSFLLITALLALATPTFAQGRKPASPHETVSTMLGDTKLTITYGRPFTTKPGTTEARKIWGGLVSWDKAWRMGADQATTLVTPKSLQINGVLVKPGTYTLYFVPSETGVSKLAVSSTTGKWGIPVDEKNDVARVEVMKSPLEKSVDQFTISLETPGTIKWSWEKTQYYVQFKAVD